MPAGHPCRRPVCRVVPPEESPPMCYPVPCRICGKTTWAGCGQHVEEALAGIPAAQRCAGHPEPDRSTPRDATGRRPGALGRLLHR